jgi:hypothetical protein
MPGQILTIASTIQCMHGGTVILATSNSKFGAGAFALLESDVHVVAGCPFTVGPKYSPCVQVEWTAGAAKVKVQGAAVLVQSSVGKCISAEGAPQGVAIIANTQTKGSAQ